MIINDKQYLRLHTFIVDVNSAFNTKKTMENVNK